MKRTPSSENERSPKPKERATVPQNEFVPYIDIAHRANSVEQSITTWKVAPSSGSISVNESYMEHKIPRKRNVENRHIL